MSSRTYSTTGPRAFSTLDRVSKEGIESESTPAGDQNAVEATRFLRYPSEEMELTPWFHSAYNNIRAVFQLGAHRAVHVEPTVHIESWRGAKVKKVEVEAV